VTARTSEAVRTLPWDDRRGTWGMAMFIATEAALFVTLFFSYFYLGRDKESWPTDAPPKITLSLVMLAVLATSSLVLSWGEKQLERRREQAARFATGVTLCLGIGFLVLQFFEYRDHLRRLAPWSDAYGSIFYTITSFHALHLTLGLLMLAYALVLPKVGPTDRPPHRALHNAAIYWHFVDWVWFVIVSLLYVLPYWTQG
jgi:heme/copper-type cytochrome/quinol oxidase subunit 3